MPPRHTIAPRSRSSDFCHVLPHPRVDALAASRQWYLAPRIRHTTDKSPPHAAPPLTGPAKALRAVNQVHTQSADRCPPPPYWIC